MTKVYISGKITGLSDVEVITNFTRAKWWVFFNVQKCETVNPLDIRPLFGVKKWPFHMIADILEQRKCDKTLMQPNWTESKGAVIEYFFAKFIFKHQIIFMPPCQTKKNEN